MVYTKKKYSKSSAATRIQRNFRRFRARKYASRYNKARTFQSRVSHAVLKKEPMQYSIFGKDQEGVSQAPFIFASISNINYSREDTNPMYYRSSEKVKPINLHMNFRLEAQDTPYNQVVVMMVRHKRSGRINDSDLQASFGPAVLGAETTLDDRPFLPSTATPNSSCANMTGTSLTAKPEMLAGLMNPKVVDVCWTKSFFVQPQWRASSGSTDTNYLAGQTYPQVKEFEVNYKFPKDIWKYPHQPTGGTAAEFPYNNKCYHILAWSDSVSGTSHPKLSANFRLSFKDID